AASRLARPDLPRRGPGCGRSGPSARPQRSASSRAPAPATVGRRAGSGGPRTETSGMTATQYGLGAVRRHFAQVAGVYGAVRMTDVEPVRDLATLLPTGALRGLEVGCGTGRYTELLLEHLAAGSSIVGLDACFEMIQVLR